MSADIVSTVMLTLASRTQQGAQIAVLRKAQQMEQAMLQMVDEAPQAASVPSGQARIVDKHA